jgi:hypothetical protein
MSQGGNRTSQLFVERANIFICPAFSRFAALLLFLQGVGLTWSDSGLRREGTCCLKTPASTTGRMASENQNTSIPHQFWRKSKEWQEFAIVSQKASVGIEMNQLSNSQSSGRTGAIMIKMDRIYGYTRSRLWNWSSLPWKTLATGDRRARDAGFALRRLSVQYQGNAGPSLSTKIGCQQKSFLGSGGEGKNSFVGTTAIFLT